MLYLEMQQPKRMIPVFDERDPRYRVCCSFPSHVCATIFGLLELVGVVMFVVSAAYVGAAANATDEYFEVRQFLIAGAVHYALTTAVVILMLIGIAKVISVFILPQLFLQTTRILLAICCALFFFIRVLPNMPLTQTLVDHEGNKMEHLDILTLIIPCVVIFISFALMLFQLMVYISVYRYLCDKKLAEQNSIAYYSPEVKTALANENYEPPPIYKIDFEDESEILKK